MTDTDALSGMAEAVSDVKEQNVEVKVMSASDRLIEAKLTHPPKPFSKSMLKLYFFCTVGFMCSSLYGFDASLMGSLLVLKPFQEAFGAEVAGIQAGYITSMFQIGSVCVIPFVGIILDKLGRRLGIHIGCTIVICGVILQGTAAKNNNSLSQYLAGRFFIGFGTALAASAAPAYVVEIAHPAYRGILSGCYNCTYDIGGIIAAGATRGASKFDDQSSWLIPTWLQMVFVGIVFICIWWIPESPRWNYTHGHKDKALDFLVKYHGNGDENNAYVILQMTEFSESLEFGQLRWWDFRDLVRTRGDRIRLMNALTLAIFSAWSSGGMGNYVGKFYETAGITNVTTVLNFNLGYNFYSAFFAYLGASFCNMVNRRTLLLFGMSCIVICWVGMTAGTAVYAKTASVGSARAGIAFYFLFASAFGISLTPLCGLYPYEVLSYKQRAKGASVYSLVNSAAALVNQFGTPVALQRIGWKMYVILACWCFIQLVWAYFTIVETRGFTLEELDGIYAAKNPLKESLRKKQVLIDLEGGEVVVLDDRDIKEKEIEN